MKVNFLADPEYQVHFTECLKNLGVLGLNPPADLILDLTFLRPLEKLERLSKFETNVPIVCNTLTMSATSAKRAARKDARIIGMPILPYYFARQKSVEYSLPFGAKAGEPSHYKEVVDGFLASIGKTGELVTDAIAGVFPRTLAMIVNEAAFAVQESVATAQDIDTAMKLGTNYPKGPLAWCDEIGAEAIVAILDALAGEYGSERYRVATLLRRHAESGQHFLPQAS